MRRSATLGVLLSFVGACSTRFSSDATADAGTSDAAPVVHGGQDNDWSCLGRVTLPAPTSTSIAVSFSVVGIDNQPASGVKVRACPDPTDATCVNGSAAQTTDAEGAASFDVAPGFAGYFEAMEQNDVTDLHFVPMPIVSSPHRHGRVEWRGTDVQLLLETVDLSIDDAKGQVLVQTQDCRSHHFPQYNAYPPDPTVLAGGVRVTLDPMPAGVVLAYVVGTPHLHVSREATETDDYGGAGFVNVPPGTYTVTGTRAETGERIGSQRIHVRANAFSLLVLTPTP